MSYRITHKDLPYRFRLKVKSPIVNSALSQHCDRCERVSSSFPRSRDSSECRRVSPAIWDPTVLPFTQHRRTYPASYMGGKPDLCMNCCNLPNGEAGTKLHCLCEQLAHFHYLAVHRAEVKLRTARSLV